MRKHLFALAAVVLVGVAAPLIPQMAHGQNAVAAGEFRGVGSADRGG